MAKGLDLILVWGLLGALSLYKLVALFRHRNDPAKRQAIISTTQVFPEWLTKFIYGENSGQSAGNSSAQKPR